MADVGKNIKKIRKEKNFTQEDLAERLHCTRQTISNYENGKSAPDIELLIEIAGVLDVEVNDLIYGLKKKENRRKQKAAAVIILVTAIVMLAVIALLMPAAKNAQKIFNMYPNFLLRVTFRPIALTLFGWGLVETLIELFEIPMEKVMYKKFARFAYYVLLVCMSVLIFVTLWMGVEMVCEWYMSDKIMKVQDSFSSSDIPHLIPGALEKAVLNIYIFGNGAETWYCPLLGVAFAVCRKIKN
ncbi:MAG: helix-turn-helix domain-containing protein [Lachnospiraceae bacterium]|nr:helix-turn-helix domain-containing protein [Lachnospiraceae bacterium]